MLQILYMTFSFILDLVRLYFAFMAFIIIVGLTTGAIISIVTSIQKRIEKTNQKPIDKNLK